MCTALVLSSFSYSVFAADSDADGSLRFFFADNLSAELSFEYETSYSGNANVKITNLTEDNIFYNEKHTPIDGIIALYDIALEGEGNFRLEISSDVSNLVRDFSYLGADYVTDFPAVTSDDVAEELSLLTASSHPYLFGTSADFAALSQKIHSGTDSYLTQSYSKIKNEASVYLKSNPSSVDVTKTYISRGFEGWEIVMYCGFVYLMEKDTDSEAANKYAQRAYDEAAYFCSLSSWGTYQYIDNNQLAFAVALCYDWLYTWLDDTQKQTLVSGLKAKHLDTVYDLLENPDKDEYQSTFYLWYFGIGNHTVLDNSATVVEALAIADLDPQYSASIIAAAMDNLHRPLARLAPDSMWAEGAGYWTFVGPFVARMLDALDSSIGTTFGWSQLPVIKNMGYFPIYQQSSQGAFVFCDAGDSLVTSPERFYFGKLLDDTGMQSYCLANSPAYPLLCLWYDAGTDYSDSNSFQTDMLYRHGDTVTMRSDWDSDTELFAAMSVNMEDSAEVAYLYQNSGTFVIDALGEQWIKNPGRDSYSLPKYSVPHNAASNQRWQYYCTRAEANSCVVINPDNYGGQNISFGDSITGFDASKSEVYACADLSSSYKDNVTSYNRGIRMNDYRRRVIVRDEISMDTTADVYSFLSVYKSDITLLPSGDGAILSKGNKKMLVKVYADSPYTLTSQPASRIDGTVPAEGETDWTVDYERLMLCFEDVKAVNVDMVFIPYYGDDMPFYEHTSQPISAWSVGKADELPTLDYIAVDGQRIADYNKNIRFYNIIADTASPKITASSSDGEVSVKKSGSDYSVTVTSDNGISNTYYITVAMKGIITSDTMVGGSSTASGSGDFCYWFSDASDKTELVARYMNKYSILLYYKLDLSGIPEGKRLKNLTLRLHGYRQRDRIMNENLAFYLVDYDSWQDDVNVYSAPVVHDYNNQSTWYPLRQRSSDGTFTEVEYDKLASISFENTIPLNFAHDASLYSPIEIDITDLYEKNGQSDYLSFVMAVPKLDSRSNAVLRFTSSEYEDETKRPAVYAELEDEICVKQPRLTGDTSYIEDAVYDVCEPLKTPSAGSLIRVVSAVSNISKAAQSGVMYVAQYNIDGALVSVSLTRYEAPASGETLNLISDKITVSDKAASIKCFVTNDDLAPLVVPSQSYTAGGNAQR